MGSPWRNFPQETGNFESLSNVILSTIDVFVVFDYIEKVSCKRLEISLFDQGILVQTHWNIIHKQVCTLLCHLIMAYSVVLRNEIIRSWEYILMLSCEAAYCSGNSSHRHSVALCHSVMCRRVGYRNREWQALFNKYRSLSRVSLCDKAQLAFTKARPKGKCRKQES